MFSYRTIHRFFYKHAYLFLLALIVILGYLPISFQLLSLKNDIIQLDLPVKYFISQELHRGEWPNWIYSWKAGFPLGHLFSWSMYNPITLFFCGLFKYDIHVLHLEFMTYLLIGGFGIYAVCSRIILLSPIVCMVAGVIYSLSGITISCSQFLAYISSIAILPWVFFFAITIIRNPGLLNSLYFAITGFILISWSYPGIVIVSLYAIILLFNVSHYFFDSFKLSKKSIRYTLLSVFIIIILSLPLIYTTLKTLPLFSRSHELINKDNNFGFLHIDSILSLFYPFFNADNNYTDTTFLFQNIYVGVIAVGVLLAGLVITSYVRTNKVVQFLFIGSLVALILSCGEAFYVKGILDKVLPGFKWFRFPSLFRIFFLLPVSILVGIGLEKLMEHAKHKDFIKKSKRLFQVILLLSAVLILFRFFVNDYNFPPLNYRTWDRSGLFSAINLLSLIWVLFLLFYFFKINSFKFLPTLIVIDVLIMSLISMPVYSVSSYSLKDVNAIIKPTSIINDQILIDHSKSTFVDKNENIFNSINVYNNKISIIDQYTGPLYLKSFDQLSMSKYQYDLPAQLIFSDNQENSSKVVMDNAAFSNNTFSAEVFLKKPDTLKLFQLWHPFWKAFVNGEEQQITQSSEGIMQVNLPAGTYALEFIYGDRLISFLNYLYFAFLSFLILSIGIITFRKKYVQKV